VNVQSSLLRLVLVAAFSSASASSAQDANSTQSPHPIDARVAINWDKVITVSKTTPTLQVVVNPPLRRGTPVHDNAFQALHNLQADYVRYVPWLPYPRLGVAELEPPANGKTFWNFSLIDPLTVDFLEATKGHPVILNFSTIPQWMYKTDKLVSYPVDPNQVTWDYERGTELRDPSGKEVADYYARLLSWYTRGGFTDELGVRHESGYHYQIPYWEVLNEVEAEHEFTPETYTRLYDAVVTAMKRVQPDIRFVGMALAFPSQDPHFFEYFLDHRNHQPGMPLDFISYHFYATPSPDQSAEVQQFTFFAQADGFLNSVRYIESIRQRLSPETRTTIDEIGSISADDGGQNDPQHVTKAIPNSYWNLSGAMYAYLFGRFSSMGIDVAGESQLVGYPTQFPSVSMVDWTNGQPNARFWVLKLLRDNFGPGDKLIATDCSSPYVYAQAFLTFDGKRKLLLVNERNRTFSVTLNQNLANGQITYVDQTTAYHSPVSARSSSTQVDLGGYSVTVVTFEN
jgi:hypothetical protein